jgi:hypothetical protein
MPESVITPADVAAAICQLRAQGRPVSRVAVGRLLGCNHTTARRHWPDGLPHARDGAATQAAVLDAIAKLEAQGKPFSRATVAGMIGKHVATVGRYWPEGCRGVVRAPIITPGAVAKAARRSTPDGNSTPMPPSNSPQLSAPALQSRQARAAPPSSSSIRRSRSSDAPMIV